MSPVSRSSLVTVRQFVPADYNFIISTWLKGLRYGNEWFGMIEQKTYYEHQHMVIEKILEDPGTNIKVACLKADPEVILAYSILRKDDTVLDWTFCKSAWRGIGLAKSLVPLTVKTVTHVTKSGVSIIKKHPLSFNPYL